MIINRTARDFFELCQKKLVGDERAGCRVAVVEACRAAHLDNGAPEAAFSRPIASNNALLMTFVEGVFCRVIRIWRDGQAMLQAGWS